jgi:formylglycine-generating enzyme required for sulfatase activity/Mrp family chromosome partitioning ATPase
MSQNPQPQEPFNLHKLLIDIIKLLIDKIRDQPFLFALAVIIVIALVGTQIPPDFRPLVYFVVGAAMLLYVVLAIVVSIRKNKPTPPSALPSAPLPPATTAGAPARAQEARTPTPLSDSEQLRAYLDCVINNCIGLRLVGISETASDPQRRLSEVRNPLMLAQVFVSLRVDRYRGEPEGQTRPEGSGRPFGSEREQLTALEGLSGENASRAVLLGLPGAGKSTVLRYLAFRMAEAYLKPQMLKNTLPEWQNGVLLPVLVPLARLAEMLPPKSERGLDGRVLQFIQSQVETLDALRGFAKRIESEAHERGVLFLFDGLDEVAPEKRAVVKAALVDYLSTRRACRAVVTCRTFSYGDPAWQLEDWPYFQLAPLSPEGQREFIAKWYDALVHNDPASRAMYQKKAEKLEQAIFSGDVRQLQQISDNPLLLTLIASVHTHQDELPRSRVLIYEQCVKLLLLYWQTQRQPNAPLRSVLEAMRAVAPDKASSLDGLLLRGLYEVAFNARQGRGQEQGETTVIDAHQLQAALLPKLGQAATDVFLEYCQTANGLLLAQGSRRRRDRPADEEPVACFAFPHPSFEEYLAARYLRSLPDPQEALAERNARNDRWFYVGLFMAEYEIVENKLPGPVTTLVAGLLSNRWAGHGEGDGYWRNVWLAGTIWPIFRAEFPDLCDAALQARVVEQLKTLCVDGHLPPPQRAAAGDALAALGDPREEVIKPDKMEFCLVPAGEFSMGSDEAPYDDEKPQHEVNLPYDYQISRYPVTQAQFKAFVEAGGYRKQAYWTEAQAAERWKDGKLKWRYYQLDEKKELQVFEGGEAESPYPFSAPFDLPNHPVVGVSWYEALAFTRWLTDEWRKCGKISADEIVRLPTEAEWEKAARGTDKRIYAWEGDQDPTKANVAETGIGSTSAVGIFPTGASPYKCLDMIGNVWEWTQSLWGRDWRKPDFRYPYQNQKEEREDIKAGDDVWRVLRGGAWYFNWGDARAAYRGGSGPGYRYDGFGFRVVVAPNSRS